MYPPSKAVLHGLAAIAIAVLLVVAIAMAPIYVIAIEALAIFILLYDRTGDIRRELRLLREQLEEMKKQLAKAGEDETNRT